MHSSLVLAALLCFTTWMSSVHATPISKKNCCVVWSKRRIPLNRIVNYAIQTEDTCRIKAVQLRTVLGKTICANPNAEWTKKAIEKVNNENLQEKKPNDKGSTSDMTPAGSMSTTSTPVASTASPTSGSIPQKNVTMGEGRQEGGTRSRENVSEKSQNN